jgi:hypothetical protein
MKTRKPQRTVPEDESESALPPSDTPSGYAARQMDGTGGTALTREEAIEFLSAPRKIFPTPQRPGPGRPSAAYPGLQPKKGAWRRLVKAPVARLQMPDSLVQRLWSDSGAENASAFVSWLSAHGYSAPEKPFDVSAMRKQLKRLGIRLPRGRPRTTK